MKRSLSKPEWAVMAALWKKPHQTISGIIAAMDEQMDWKYNTYVTYVGRLVDKGLVGYTHMGRDNFYYALVERKQCVRAESRHILDKFSDGSAKDLLICMIHDIGLSAKDREELKMLLDDMGKEGENK